MAPIKATAGEIAPKGDQPAVCMHVLDMGMQQFQGDEDFKHKVMFFFELAERMEDNRPFMLSKEYTLTLHPKGKLGPDFARWRGEDLSVAELTEGLDLEERIGKGVMLEVIHKTGSGGAPSARIDRLRALSVETEVPKGITEAPPKWATDRVEKSVEEWAAFRSGKPVKKEGDSDTPF